MKNKYGERYDAQSQMALDRMRRAYERGTGCHLTKEMIENLSVTFLGEVWLETPPIQKVVVYEDPRPYKGLWAPGGYYNQCMNCLTMFIGDKRAQWCAVCAYKEGN